MGRSGRKLVWRRSLITMGSAENPIIVTQPVHGDLLSTFERLFRDLVESRMSMSGLGRVLYQQQWHRVVLLLVWASPFTVLLCATALLTGWRFRHAPTAPATFEDDSGRELIGVKTSPVRECEPARAMATRARYPAALSAPDPDHLRLKAPS